MIIDTQYKKYFARLPALVLLTFFPFSIEGQAGEPAISAASTSIYDSVYLYNALENKTSLSELLNNKTPALATEDLEAYQEEASLEEKELIETIKEITAKQNLSVKKLDESINNAGELKTLMVGNDLGTIRYELVQLKGLTSELYVLGQQTGTISLKLQINDQLKFLEEKQEKVEDFLEEQQNKFSLLGWFRTII